MYPIKDTLSTLGCPHWRDGLPPLPGLAAFYECVNVQRIEL